MPKTKKEYTREQLLKSKRFSGYQRDFVAAVLSKDRYTMDEAQRAITAFFGADTPETKKE